MKVQFINAEDTDYDSMGYQLVDILTETQAKLKEEKGEDVVDIVMIEAEFTLGLVIAGQEAPQYLTVEHHKGVPELFKWVVDLEKGSADNNEEASYFDAWSVAKYEGKEKTFVTVETVYDDGDLVLDSLEEYGTMEKRTLNHVDGFTVVRIYQDERLIQEYKLTPKEAI